MIMNYKSLVITATLALLSFGVPAQDCDKLYKKKLDKYKGEINFFSAPLKPILFLKNVKEGEEKYYMSLTAGGNIPSVGGKGAIVLLGNGEKISRDDAEVDVEVASNTRFSYSYNVFTEISEEEIDLISEYGITGFQLYIFDNELKSKDIELVKKQAKCLTSLK